MKIKLSDSQQKLVDVMMKEKLQLWQSNLNPNYFYLEKMKNEERFNAFVFSSTTVRSLIRKCILRKHETYPYSKYKLSETILKNQQNEN